MTTWTDRHGTSYVRPPELAPTAPEYDDVLHAVARALADGRAAVLALRRAHDIADIADDTIRDRDAATNGVAAFGERDDPPPF